MDDPFSNEKLGFCSIYASLQMWHTYVSRDIIILSMNSSTSGSKNGDINCGRTLLNKYLAQNSDAYQLLIIYKKQHFIRNGPLQGKIFRSYLLSPIRDLGFHPSILLHV